MGKGSKPRVGNWRKFWDGMDRVFGKKQYGVVKKKKDLTQKIRERKEAI